MTDIEMSPGQIVSEIQAHIKAPKGQFNKFGNYYYRNVEDILEGLKPLLLKYHAHINLTDDLIYLAERMYVKATATLSIHDVQFQSTAYAREPFNKKGMDDMQITGSASSYARKTALSGLLALDDTRDTDNEEDELMHGQMDIKPINFDKVHQAVDFFRTKIDQDDIETTWEIIQAAHQRLTNDEKSAVAKKLGEFGKASGSNKKYTTLLKDYLIYIPPEPRFDI